jgi:sugar phosphate permease
VTWSSSNNSIVSIGTFGVLAHYFDRLNLSVSQAALHNAFGISTVTFASLLSAYSWTYAALPHPVLGFS